jgi:hypothetical protein
MRIDIVECMAVDPKHWWSAGQVAAGGCPGTLHGLGMALRGLFTRGYVERRRAPRVAAVYRLKAPHEALRVTKAQAEVFLAAPQSGEWWTPGAVECGRPVTTVGLLLLQMWERRPNLLEWEWTWLKIQGKLKRRQRHWRLTRRGRQVQDDVKEIARCLKPK